MARNKRPTWADVAEKIVREGKSILHAARDLGIEIDPTELDDTYNTKEFQSLLWTARLNYATEIANQPGRTKSAALGLMTIAMYNLAAEGEWEKVIEAVLKLAKVEGWVGGESNVNVFANLTQKDIDEAKKRLEQFAKPSGQPDADTSPILPN